MDTPDVRAEDLTTVVATMLGRPVALGFWRVDEVPYASGSPATGGLYRVHGTTQDGQQWSVFGKLLHHVRHWPRLHYIPQPARDEFVADFPWRGELLMWEPGFARHLPPGLRVPELYRVTDLGDDRLLVWMENVEVGQTSWDTELFARAANLLGGLAARRSAPEIVGATGYPVGYALRRYYESRVVLSALPMLESDELWRHPLIAGAADPSLREDMRRLARSLPALLDRLDGLPQAVPHGDASPQNLLVPVSNPQELVAIDIAFQTPQAIGFDLGQLLVGLVHAGEMPAAKLAEVHEVLVAAFAAGVKEHGVDVSQDELHLGYVGSLLVRAGFTALPFEMLGAEQTPQTAEMFRERAALTRFLIDLGAQL